MPDNFEDWGIQSNNDRRRTIAHEAAHHLCLSNDFAQWDLAYPNGWSVAHEFAMAGGIFPDGFDRWDLKTVDGWTVAHFAAEQNTLPAFFDSWELANNAGWSVAHVAAQTGHLPVNFQKWTISDEDGWSVAHTAAANRHLPADFTYCWDLTFDILPRLKSGEDVKQVFAENI